MMKTEIGLIRRLTKKHSKIRSGAGLVAHIVPSNPGQKDLQELKDKLDANPDKKFVCISAIEDRELIDPILEAD